MLSVLNECAKQDFQLFVESGGEKSKEFCRWPVYKISDVVNLGFDTEDDSKGNVHLLIFYDGKEYYIFKDKVTALLWLLFTVWEQKRILIWCVNTDYDITNLSWGYDYLIDRFYNKTRFVFGRLKFNRSVWFYDLINFYSLSAAKVGELFGLKKLPTDFRSVKYCKRDTQIAWRAGEFINDKFKQWGIRHTPTVASCALQIYVKQFCPIDFEKGYAYYKHIVTNREIYPAYFGGRVEPFHYGIAEGNIKYYDINSLYPYVMQKFQYPNPFSNVKKRNSVDIENGIVCCTVKVSKCNIPPLPHRLEKGKLIFPIGTFKGTWTIPELHNAMENGTTVEKLHWAYEWEYCDDLFSEYVNNMYKARLESKLVADKYFYKVLMNSLYGKFAEKRRYTVYVDLEDGSPFDPIVFDRCQVTEEYIPEHSHVILSAYVTSYGRIELYNWMLFIEAQGGEVLYCDTDSIIYKGDFELTTGVNLGEMKKEADVNFVEVLGAKYYRYRTTDDTSFFVCKGVPKEKQADMFTDKVVHYNRPIRYREAIRRKLQANVWLPFTKKDLTKFDKRVILKHGKTKPVTVKIV